MCGDCYIKLFTQEFTFTTRFSCTTQTWAKDFRGGYSPVFWRKNWVQLEIESMVEREQRRLHLDFFILLFFRNVGGRNRFLNLHFGIVFILFSMTRRWSEYLRSGSCDQIPIEFFPDRFSPWLTIDFWFWLWITTSNITLWLMAKVQWLFRFACHWIFIHTQLLNHACMIGFLFELFRFFETSVTEFYRAQLSQIFYKLFFVWIVWWDFSLQNFGKVIREIDMTL